MTLAATLRGLPARLCRDSRGAMVIETAIVAPVLILLALGGYEASRIISRQHELQSGGNEAEAIALAANQGAQTNTTTVEQILMASLGLADDKVTVTKVYRCGTGTTLYGDNTSCSSGQFVSSYAQIALTDTYTPAWTKFGIGGPVNFSVTRVVYLSMDRKP